MNLPRAWQDRARVSRCIAGVLTVLALVVFGWKVIPLQQELANIDAPVAPADVGTESDGGPDQSLLSGFPRSDANPTALRVLLAAARDSGVDLVRGEYRLVGGAQNEQLLRYEMVFPVQASYPQIRAFVARTLADLPYAAVDSITFERRHATETRVSARIKFTLFVRRAAV